MITTVIAYVPKAKGFMHASSSIASWRNILFTCYEIFYGCKFHTPWYRLRRRGIHSEQPIWRNNVGLFPKWLRRNMLLICNELWVLRIRKNITYILLLLGRICLNRQRLRRRRFWFDGLWRSISFAVFTRRHAILVPGGTTIMTCPT